MDIVQPHRQQLGPAVADHSAYPFVDVDNIFCVQFGYQDTVFDALENELQSFCRLLQLACRLISHSIKMSPLVAPYQAEYRSGPEQKGTQQPGKTEEAFMQRAIDFVPIQLDHHKPRGLRYGPDGRHYRMLPVVLAFDDSDRARNRHHHRQVLSGQGDAQLEGSVSLKPQIVQEKHVIAVTPDKQGLCARAGGRPALDQRVERSLGIYFHDEDPEHFLPIHGGENGNGNFQIRGQVRTLPMKITEGDPVREDPRSDILTCRRDRCFETEWGCESHSAGWIQ